MAQLISVKLSRFDNSPWGFRLQGGKDFGTPLVVQKVNGGSPAEAAGLRAGDAVIKVNNTDMFSLRHKDAQDVIVRAGNNFEVTVQRGGSTWKPSVTPVSATLPTPKPSSPATHIIPVTKTSLAAKKQEGPLIGSGHNFSPKPFLNGNGEAPIKSIVNKQYNSPVGIYSEETIAETLSAQAEVLAGGVLGVNFKKNEKNYNAENSEVFKMVQEADKEPRTPEPAEPTIPSGVVTPTSPAVSGLAGLRHVSAPETKSQPTTPQTSLPPGQNICADCERLIVGVFVRIKEKNLHVECFKCSTCGTSLKNVGYYNINNKLYCDIHAKLVARQNPPAPGFVPVTVPASKAPAGTISAALAQAGANIPPLAPLSPSLNNHSSPLPFNSNRQNVAIVNDSLQRLRLENDNSGFTSTTITPRLMTEEKDIPNRHADAKTFTSTLIIQRGNEVGSNNDNDLLSYNNIINNELGSELGIVNNNSVVEVCEFDLTDDATTTEEPTTDLRPIAAQPFPTRKKVSSTNNIGGPKPFGGVSNTPSLSSPSNFNSISNTLPRPQSQSVTDSYHEEFDYYEVIQTRSENSSLPSSPPPQPSVKSKSLVWPPTKSIEEITYPTASPLYINPNPALHQKYQKCAKTRPDSREQRCTEEFDRRRGCSEDRTSRQSQESMEYTSCSGPVYRKVQLYDVTTQRESRCRETRPIQRPPSRPGSRESFRRSLTPTKITQPVPQPWTATVTTGTNLYQQVYQPPTPPVPLICETIREQRQTCRENVACSGHICQRQQICERDRIIEQQYHPPRYYCQADVCPPPCVYRPVCSAEPPKKSCQRVNTSTVAEEEPKSPVIETEVSFTLRRPSSALSDTKSVRATATDNERDVIRETVEKDVGPLHVKETTIYERSIEVVDPDEENRNVNLTEARRSIHLDEEVEHISGRRDLTESAHLVTNAVETQQMIDKVKQDATRREKRTNTDNSATGYKEVAREIQIQRNSDQQDIESERRQSLREQVQVHQSLREQQIPDRRQQPQTLQERRLSAKFNQQDFSRQQQQTNDTSCPKKHVQFVTDTETGAQPLPPTTIRNATPKQWQSEMCKALTTAPVRSYSPMIQAAFSNDGDVMEECYTTEKSYRNMGQDRPISPFVQALTIAPESRRANYCSTVNARETVVEKTTTRKPIPPEPRRAVSPFREALTTASDRPYTPLGFYDQPNQTYDIPVVRETGTQDYQRSEVTTPSSVPRSDGYCPPAEILYTDARSREVVVKRERSSSRNTATPQPLPTPPPNYHLRDSSRSPARSRSQTPSSKQCFPMTASVLGLKKPDAIPSYQKNLVHVQKCNVDAQNYSRSRSASPPPARPKSPASEPPVVCTTKAQAPKMREEHPPQISMPTVSFDKKPYEVLESYAFHEEDGECCARVLVKDDKGSRHFVYPENASKTGNYMEKEEEEEEMFERNAKTGVVAYTRVLDTNVRPCTDNSEVPPAPVQSESNRKSVYSVPKHNQTHQVTIACPIGKSQSSRFPKTGVCVLPPGPPPPPPAPKTIVIERVDTTKKSSCGPLESQFGSQRSISQSEQSAFRETKTCQKTATMIDSTSSYSKTGTCGQPAGTCGRRSGSALLDVCNGPCAGVCAVPCGDGSICVAPCTASGCSSSVQCAKLIVKSQCPFARSPTADMPFPQIPLPYDDDNMPQCPLAPKSIPVKNDLTFQPIHAPRTNLGSQLTQLVQNETLQTVKVCKPQAQCSTQTMHQTQSQYSLQTTPTSKTRNLVDPPNLSSHPDLGSGIGGSGAGTKSGSVAGNTAPKRGRGILTQQGGPGSRVPLCGHCNSYVRGPFITALGNIWCPDHFICVNSQCRRPLQDIGFVEEKGQLYCEYCFEQFIAPPCNKCSNKIKGECLNAIGKHFHPECFNCSYCGKLFGNNPFFLEDGLPYCESDWNELFTTKCFACGFPVEAGDRWVEALSNNYHSQCFNCTMCKKNLEGQSFYAKGGRPFCKNHAR